jgi:uncharacterized protein (TIGR03083 family)
MGMDDDAVWAAIDRQGMATADLLEGLTDEQWNHPSLCDGWTVRDVAAHLTLQQVGLGTAVLMGIRHPGGLNRMIRSSARSRATVPVEQLIEQIRAMVGSRRHNIGVTSREALMDSLVHGQDIAIPLRLSFEMPTEAAAVAATTVWSYRARGKSRVFRNVPVQGSRLTASDISWSVGSGPEIEGPIAAILLLLTGRLVALPRLTGDGVTALRQQLTVPRDPRCG